MILSTQLTAQNFTWIYGASGTSNGNSVTCDHYGHTFVAGGYEPDQPSFGFAFASPNYFPATPSNGERFRAFLVRYETATGAPQFSASIGVSNTSGQGSCNIAIGESYVTAHRIAINRDGDVFVLGVYKGCNLTLYDAAGFGIITTNSNAYNDQSQKVFLARYSPTFSPVSCHIYSSGSEQDVYPGDITSAATPAGNRLIVAVNLITPALVESFGGALPPLPPFDNFNMTDPDDYDIYLTEIDLVADQIVNGESVGGDGNDFAAELSSGPLGYYPHTADLYLTGAFKGDIQFENNSLGTTTVFSNGDYDIFAVQFQNYDLTNQVWVTAGGPYRDEALAMSDEGKYIGGYISDDATFPGFAGTFEPYTTSTWDADYNVNGNRLEVGFLAMPDFGSGSWIWADDFPANRDSQVNSLATGQCGDIYMAYNRGMHANPNFTLLNEITLSLPYTVFWADHLWLPNANYGGPHSCYSQLSKWRDQGASAPTLEWSHDFAILGTVPITGNGTNIAARFITDIELSPKQPNSVGTDILYTGRFGRLDTAGSAYYMEIPNSVTGNPTVFNGTLGAAYNHGTGSMFLGGLAENPNIVIDTQELCLTDDSVDIMSLIEFDPSLANGAVYNIAAMNFVFSGTGVTTSGYFNPLTAGYGTHTVYATYNYFGCSYVNVPAFVFEVKHDDFVIHPVLTGTSWAEGMGVDAWPYIAGSDIVNSFDTYFNSGKFQGSITFEKFDGTNITLTSNPGITSGYVVAYGPCGALWATNFKGAAGLGSYVEAVVMDKSSDRLYAVGSVQNGLSFVNSNSLSGPTTSTNGQTLSSNSVKKGFVSQLDARTGEVIWIYFGSDNSSHNNNFHGMALYGNIIAAVGEYENNFTDNTFNYSLASTGGVDIVTVVLDTLGNDLDAASLGANYEDHGDAISFFPEEFPNGLRIHAVGIGDVKGGSGMNVVLPMAPTTYNSALIGSARGTDVFLWHYSIMYNTGDLSLEQWRVFEGLDDDHGLDVKIMGIQDVFGQTPNEVVYCGQFTSEIDTSSAGSGIMMPALAGSGGIDGFIGTCDYNLGNIGWFNAEGSSSVFSQNESVDALAFDTETESVYAVGKFERTPTATLLNSAAFTGITNNRTYLFTLQFDPNGNFIDASYATPNNSGVNEQTDVAIVDTSCITTGVMALPFLNDYIEFYLPNPNGTIVSVNGNHETFIARFDATDNAYYKRGSQALETDLENPFTLFPNPNNGNFTLEFERNYKGSVTLFNSAGQLVTEQFVSGNRFEFSHSLPAGLYLLKMVSSAESMVTRVVVE